MKRILLCALLALTLLCSACTPSTQETTAPATPEPSFAGPVGEELRTVALATWIMEPDAEEWQEKISAAINRILEERGSPLRLEIQSYYLAGNPMTGEPAFSEVIEGKVDSGVDLFFDNYEYQGKARQYALDGHIADITEALARFPDLYALTPEKAWKETSVDGRIVCFPLLDGYDSNARETEIALRQDVVEQLGAEPPRTPEDVTALIRRIREEVSEDYLMVCDPSTPPYALHRTYPEWPFMVDRQSRFIFHEDGTVEPYVGSEIFRKDQAWITSMEEAGLLRVTEDVGDAADKVAVAFAPHDVEGGTAYENGTLVESTESYAKLALLAPDNARFRMGPCASRALYVSSRADSVEDALMMIEMLYTDREITDLLFYGVEGEDWTLMEDGSADFVADLWNDVRHWHHERAARPRSGAVLSEAASATMDFPAGGFLFDEKLETAPAWADISFMKVWTMRTGMMSVEALPDVLAELNASGYQEMLAECQRQYTTYIEMCQ